MKLLVSVRDCDEVSAALMGGADWIDLKEPKAGPLAAVDVAVARRAVQTLDGRRTLSAALGELRDWQDSPARGLLDIAGIGVVKLGLAGCDAVEDWKQQWLAVSRAATQTGKQLVAVIYADWQRANAPPFDEILNFAKSAGARFLLLDTFDKQAGSILDQLTKFELEWILQQAKRARLTTVLAGSLSPDALGRLPRENVDMLAVRGAVCRGERTGRVDQELVREFCNLLAADQVEGPIESAEKIDLLDT